MAFYKNWREEKRSAYLYGVLSQNEKNVLHKKLFADLKVAADKQALTWERKMSQAGEAIPSEYKPDFKARVIAYLTYFLGAESMQSMLSVMKIRGMAVFGHYHNEHQHTSLNASSNIRAAVFGVNDGLISNISLMLGMVGAQANHHVIVMAGIAGLLAGACSMAAGEYISVRSQREVFEYQIAIEKEELEEYPEEEAEELSLIYQARGVPKESADQIAKIMIENPETGLNTLAREELGLNPDDLVSPYGAMFSSFISFAIGAFIPLLPFLLLYSSHTILISIGLTAFSLFGIGMLMSFFTNKAALLLGLRMLLVGTVAGAITYGVGRLLDIGIV